VPLFQAAWANFNPFGGETAVDVKNPQRGPLLIIDHGWPEVADLAVAFIKRFP
jgi:hypothetical protein